MIKVIEHGYRRYNTTCYDCKCCFEYEISDVDSKNMVQCPDCKRGCYHNATLNADLTSKFEDNAQYDGRMRRRT